MDISEDQTFVCSFVQVFYTSMNGNTYGTKCGLKGDRSCWARKTRSSDLSQCEVKKKGNIYRFMLTLQSFNYQSNVFTNRIKQGSQFDVSLLYF